jgi:hypothetical protein
MPTKTRITTNIRIEISVCMSKISKFVDAAFDAAMKYENARG